MGAAVLTETVFNWPGLGSKIAQSAANEDLPVVLGLTVVVIIVYGLANLLVDVQLRVPRPADPSGWREVTSAADTLVEAVGLDTTLHEVGPPRSLGQDAWRRFKRNRLATFGLVLVVALMLVALIGPFVVKNPSFTGYPPLEKPTNQHWFGTDNLGRDELSRVVYGIRLSCSSG